MSYLVPKDILNWKLSRPLKAGSLLKHEVRMKKFAQRLRISSSMQSQNDRGEESCFNLAFYLQYLQDVLTGMETRCTRLKERLPSNTVQAGSAAGHCWHCADPD